MVDPDAIFKKIERADKHLEDLNREAERFWDEKRGLLYRLNGEAEVKGSHYRFLFRAELLQPLPMIEWGIRVGDAIHCLRSALDQLVYGISASPDGNTAFPIFGGAKEWFTKAPAMLWGIPEPVVTVIDRHQPYHRGNAADTHPLAALRELSNADKHRYITVVALIPTLLSSCITHQRGIQAGDLKIWRGATLEEGAIVATMPFQPDGSGRNPEVKVNAEFRYRIAFGKADIPSSLAGKPLKPAFDKIADAVVEAIKEIGGTAHGSSPP